MRERVLRRSSSKHCLHLLCKCPAETKASAAGTGGQLPQDSPCHPGMWQQPPAFWRRGLRLSETSSVTKLFLSLWHQRCWCLQSPASEGGSLFSALKSPWCLWDGWSCRKIGFFFGRSRHGILHQHCGHQISRLYLAICFGGLQRFVQAVQKQTESTTQCKNVPQPTSSPKGLDGKFIGAAKQNSKKKISVTPLTHHMASENHTFLTGLANAG